MTDPCPICRDTGIAHSAPHIAGVTMTACTCEAGQRFVREIAVESLAREMNAELPEETRAMLRMKGQM